MGNHITSAQGIAAADQKHREDMQAASNALLTAMFRELAAREARRG